MKDSLSYLAFLKSPYSSSKHSTYFEVYDQLFVSYRNREITFVEIGVLGGGSLFMWREFFGPQARIIGVDLNPNAKKWEEHGFEIFIGSQSDESFWREFVGKVGSIDVVLDDGGHTYEQQIVTTEMLIDNINNGGILVVEDTHTSYMKGFGPIKYSFIEYTKNMIDLINRRYAKFNDTNSEKRIWSVQIYESFVAFSVNRPASNALSVLTLNNGEDDHAKDFRYEDSASLSKLGVLGKKLKTLKIVPGVDFIGRHIRTFLVNRKFGARRFFGR